MAPVLVSFSITSLLVEINGKCSGHLAEADRDRLSWAAVVFGSQQGAASELVHGTRGFHLPQQFTALQNRQAPTAQKWADVKDPRPCKPDSQGSPGTHAVWES